MKRLFLAALVLAFGFGALSPVRANALVLEKNGHLDFTRKDNLALPTYNWPRTLLCYPVDFEGGIRSAAELTLIDNRTSRPVPFQLARVVKSGERIVTADLHFFASLPSGGDYSFTLKREAAGPVVETRPVISQNVGGRHTVSNGILRVTLPVSVSLDADRAEAPVFAKDAATGARSVGQIVSKGPRIRSVDVSEVESGPLFAQYAVTYRFGNDAAYRLDIKVVSGYPFVILDERIEGLTVQDSVRMELTWADFAPVYRYPLQWDRTFDSRFPWYRIDEPVYTNYCREDPAWTGRGTLENVAERMLFRLTPFGGNSVREQVPLISFWEEKGDELGIFVYDHERWDDGQYGIWQQGPDLSVGFRYRDKQLGFLYPLVSGTRSTAIALYGADEGERACEMFDRALDAIGGSMTGKNTAYRYATLLHSQYALLNLDRVKNWQLEYPKEGARGKIPFQRPLPKSSPEEFLKEVKRSCMAYYMMGLNGYPGVHSIEHRNFYGRLTQGYLDNYQLLDNTQRRQVEALLLLAGYVNMTEAMNAIRTCLAGTANMAADGWSVTGVLSALFPEHEMARTWADFFAKSLEIYGIFYTRPDVPRYESFGGRWVESLGIYNWAYFKPTVAANLALWSTRGENRFPGLQMARRGRWMTDMLTAPVRVRTSADSTERLQRVYTAHGAHSGGRFVEQYSYVYQLARFLENYDPMQAEHLYWGRDMGRAPEGKPNDSCWDDVFAACSETSNNGTDPHLKSVKYTGHGIVLRAGVGTPEELSIHLDQVDKGPNYRWGNQGSGHSGGLYFYAGGKIYCGHENEAAGDHTQNDTDGVTNFGVMKDGTFRTVGYNELTAPLYDLDIAQYAEVRSSEKDGYSWPEYLSRSILLVGTDYFLIYDQTGTNWRAYHRFSWFVHKKDQLPRIFFFGAPARRDHWYTAQTENSRGFYRDNYGPLLTLVTHKEGVKPLGGRLQKPSLLASEEVYEHRSDRRGIEYEGIYEIATPRSRDIIFRNGRGLHCQEPNYAFEGEAGLIRRMNSGEIQMALFRGSKIAYGPLAMELEAQGDCAVAMTFRNPSSAIGRYKSYGAATLRIRGLKGGRLHIDGVPATLSGQEIDLPVGEHVIEYTRKEAVPMPSLVASAEYTPRGAELVIGKAPSAREVVIELSDDDGKQWRKVGRCDGNTFALKHLRPGKYHVRAVSLNGGKRADSAPEYPLYVDERKPHAPEGVRLRLGERSATLSWGTVPGVRRYVLYRQDPGSGRFRVVYEGEATTFTDRNLSGVRPCDRYPSDRPLEADRSAFYRYCVVAVNGRGTSERSAVVDTDPASWANWYPATELRFKRRSAFWMEPYVPMDEESAPYYPD